RDIYVVTPPFHLSIFVVNRAESIIKEEQLKEPLVGGHSLGGVAACRFVKNNQASRLFLFASYCDKDISQSEVAVVSLMGERDRILDRENYEDARSHLPSDAVIREVEQVNHADFGQYGYHDGDAPSRVSEERVVSLMREAFRTLESLK
ncbi:MAG: alpha/beta hydrolase, partial [Candidatus Paceibacteria bacterium]